MVISQAILYQVTIYLVFVYEQPIMALFRVTLLVPILPGRFLLANANAGIELDDNDFGLGNCIIGNLISGNGTGIHIGQLVLPGSILNTVQGNFIGTDVSGTKALPNERFGIILNDSQNTIGGPEAGQANVISGNNGGGILLFGMVNTTANIVANNLIGTDFTGMQPLPNKGEGIQIGLNGGLGGVSGNTIGSSPLLGSTPSCALESSVKRPFKKQIESDSDRRAVKRYLEQEHDLKSYSSRAMPQVYNAMKLSLSEPAQVAGLNFTAATISNALNPDIIPPQLSGWVGPQQYILMCYGSIRSFDKTTGQPDGALDIDAANFFGVNLFSVVRINYSRFLDRWLLCCEDSTGLELLVVWSDTGIITSETVWTFATFPFTDLATEDPQEFSLAYPQLAADSNAVYVSININPNAPGLIVGSSVLVIPNSAIVTGNTSPTFTVFSGILSGPNGVLFGGSNPPADNFDQNAEFGYIVQAQSYAYPCPFGPLCSYNQLFLNRIINPGSAHPTLGQEIALDVPPYADPAPAPHKGNLYSIEVFEGINAMDLFVADCYLQAPHVRNKQLYACHPIQLDSTGTGNPTGDRVGVRWYQFDLTGDPTGNGCGTETETTCPALVQWGTIYDNAASNPKFYYLPAIMTNKNGDLVIEGTVSGNDDYTNVFYAGRKAQDPLGVLRNPVLITNNTSNPYNHGPLIRTSPGIGQDWGLLSSLAPDPSNDLAIWSTGEWAAIENGWGIQATQLLPTK